MADYDFSDLKRGDTVKVVTDYCGCHYLTPGKVYEAKVFHILHDDRNFFFEMTDDEGDEVFSALKQSAYLDNRYDFTLIREM